MCGALLQTVETLTLKEGKCAGGGNERIANEHCQLNWAPVNNFIAIITHIHNANYRNFWEMKSPFAYVLLLLLVLLSLYVCIYSIPSSPTSLLSPFRIACNMSSSGHFGIKCHTVKCMKLGI